MKSPGSYSVKLLLLLVFSMLPFAGLHTVSAQATLTGRVTEADGAIPIPGITLALFRPGEANLVAMATTGPGGQFSFGSVSAGEDQDEYELRVLVGGPLKPFPYIVPSQPLTLTLSDVTAPLRIALLRRVSSDIFLGFSGPYQPSYAPDFESIAFHGFERLDDPTPTNFDIYFMDALREPQKVTTGPANDYDPSLSPDGSQIVFVSDRSGAGLDLYVVNADGSGLRRLTTDDGADEYSPQWSPDGGRIAFVSEGQAGSADIHVIDVSGENLVRLTQSPADETTPRWSPDGGRIAFVSGGGADGSRDIFTMSAAGGAAARLTDSPLDEFDPVWSPDGATIYYSTARPQTAVLTEDFASINITQFELREREFVSGAPVAGAAPIIYPNAEYAVWSVPASGGTPQRITFHDGSSYGARFVPEFVVFNVPGGWDQQIRQGTTSAVMKPDATAYLKPAAAPNLAEWNGIYYNWWTEVPSGWQNQHLIAGPVQSVENKRVQRFTNSTCNPMTVGPLSWTTEWQVGVTGNVGYGGFIGIEVTGMATESETVNLGPFTVQPGQTLIIERGALMETTTHTGTAWFRTQFTWWDFRLGSGVVTEKRQVGIDFNVRTEGEVTECVCPSGVGQVICVPAPSGATSLNPSSQPVNFDLASCFDVPSAPECVAPDLIGD